MNIDTVKLIKNGGIVFVALVVLLTAWIILRPRSSENPRQNTANGDRSQSSLQSYMTRYCRTTFREELQKKLNQPISASDVSLVNYNSTIEGDFASIAMSCNVDSLDQDVQGDGFTAFLEFKKDMWNLYDKSNAQPNCKKFDYKNWPLQVVSSCYDDTIANVRGIK